MHAENTSDIDDNFLNALALLHSTEDDSTEKLGRILDACIEERYGPEKTLAARMPKRFLCNVELRGNTAPSLRTSKKQGCAMKAEIWYDPETISLLEDNIAKNNKNHETTDVKMYQVNYEDCTDDEDVPRISIPDEGYVDGTVCKICNGAKLGPLILLECQECQEAYHPLCHQPPVIEVDIYDPRFVWRCRRCVETSSAISPRIKTAGRGTAGKARRTDDTVKENTMRLKIPGKWHGVSSGKNDTRRR